MGNMDKLRAAVQAAPEDSGARQIGEVVLMIAGASEQAAEIIAADLDNPAMGLEQCFAALRSYAQKHQQGGFWGCMCNRFDTANAVIRVVCDFYKVPLAAFGEENQAIPEPQRGEHASNRPKSPSDWGSSWRADGAAHGETMGGTSSTACGGPPSPKGKAENTDDTLDLMELL